MRLRVPSRPSACPVCTCSKSTTHTKFALRSYGYSHVTPVPLGCCKKWHLKGVRDGHLHFGQLQQLVGCLQHRAQGLHRLCPCDRTLQPPHAVHHRKLCIQARAHAQCECVLCGTVRTHECWVHRRLLWALFHILSTHTTTQDSSLNGDPGRCPPQEQGSCKL